MKTKYIFTVIALLSVITVVRAQGDLKSWLKNDCSEGDPSAAQQIASMSNADLKKGLQEALVNGPSQKELDIVRQHALETYDRNMAFLDSEKASFLSAQQVERIKSVSKDEFADREEASFVQRYHDQARIGLDLVNQMGIDYDITLSTTPSPASNSIQFSFVLPENSSYRIELFDISGKLLGQIHEGTASKDVPVRFDYNTSALSEGVYMYKVVANQRVFVDKFVIRR